LALISSPGLPGAGAAVFIDKDGTLIDNVPYNIDPALIRLLPSAGEALAQLKQLGYRLIVISNQSGVARGYFPESAIEGVKMRLAELLAEYDVALDGFYYCPHHPQGTVADYAHACDCRKPSPGMFMTAAREHGIDLSRSWMIGDILDDVEAGHRAGCRAVLLDNGNETEWEDSPLRQPDHKVKDMHEAAYAIAQAVSSPSRQLAEDGVNG
jgi:D-glycero-D-manno-heptose 1,7-bisphosphate phosphatase